jgi:rubrerythrin
MDDDVSRLTTAKDILETALYKEEAAYRFYDAVMNHTKVDFVRELVAQLREEEQKHILLIRKKLSQMERG